MADRLQLSMFNRPPAWAARYVGLPWKELGRSRAGVDCWGVYYMVARERFGHRVPVYDRVGWRDLESSEARAAARRELAAYMVGERQRLWTPVWERATARKDEPLGGRLVIPGDLVQFNMMGQPIHVGIVVAPGHMLHIEEPPEGRGSYSCCVPYDDGRQAAHVIGFYRWAGERC